MPQVFGVGKGVDGFAIAGNRLMVVDDMIWPRYFLAYDISSPRVPRHISTKEWLGQRILCVAADGLWLALLSEFFNHGYSGTEIDLINIETLKCHAHLSVEHPDSRQSKTRRRASMAAVALAGTTLFLAAEKDGLAYLDVAEWMTEKPCAVQVGSSDAAPEPLERAAEISSDKLRFVPVKTGQVCAVTPIDARRAFAVIKQGWVFTSLDTILVSLP